MEVRGRVVLTSINLRCMILEALPHPAPNTCRISYNAHHVFFTRDTAIARASADARSRRSLRRASAARRTLLRRVLGLVACVGGKAR